MPPQHGYPGPPQSGPAPRPGPAMRPVPPPDSDDGTPNGWGRLQSPNPRPRPGFGGHGPHPDPESSRPSSRPGAERIEQLLLAAQRQIAEYVKIAAAEAEREAATTKTEAESYAAGLRTAAE